MSPQTHEATKNVFREWLRDKTGKPVGGIVDWLSISKDEIMTLSNNMLNATNVPDSVRDNYFELFDAFLTGG